MHRNVRRRAMEHIESWCGRARFQHSFFAWSDAQRTCSATRTHYEVKVDVVRAQTVERISQVHFHNVAYANKKQRTRNMSFKTPGVVINHARSDFALRFTNCPVDHFATLFPAGDGNRDIWSECPTRVFARKMGLRHEHKLSLPLFFWFTLLTEQSLSEEKAQNYYHNDGRSDDQSAVAFVTHDEPPCSSAWT